jgi:hypothetical protein
VWSYGVVVSHLLGLWADSGVYDIGGVAGVRTECVGSWASGTVVFSCAVGSGCVRAVVGVVSVGGSAGVGITSAEVLSSARRASVAISVGV